MQRIKDLGTLSLTWGTSVKTLPPGFKATQRSGRKTSVKPRRYEGQMENHTL